MELNDILLVALQARASDVHLKAGLPPIFRVDGSLVPLKDGQRLLPEDVARMALGTMSEMQRAKFQQTNEVDLAYALPGVGRFRVNVFQQRGTVGAVFRAIPVKVPTITQLMLPQIVEKLAAESRGLILVTGATGTGKSTTLAAMVEHINNTETCHVITIEDPIEFLIRDKRSVVNQREVGVDTMSFGQALKSAMRQDPDVILVGEMRDLETMETALNAAETGHLVLSTLHTIDATETIQRVIAAFPPYQQKPIRLQLASVLRGVVSQRLVAREDGRGRVPAVEVMVATARVRELIEDENRTKEIAEAIAQGNVAYGMQTFDQSLMSLLQKGLISYREALRQASNPDDFALRVSGVSSTSDAKWDGFDAAAGDRAAPGQPAAAARPAGATPGARTSRAGEATATPRPGAAGEPKGAVVDDFTIERF